MIKTYLSMRLYFTSLLNRDDRGDAARPPWNTGSWSP
jgi:hypothetical protein